MTRNVITTRGITPMGSSDCDDAAGASCRVRGSCHQPRRDRSIDHEHDLAYDASLREQLLRLSCLDKRKSLRDERLDLLLLKEFEQGDPILSKQVRFQPFKRLDAVGDDSFPGQGTASRRRCTTRRWRF